jgi:glycosyltransferase involved in cell wall biosynthesis
VLLRNPAFRARQNFGVKVNNADGSLSIAFFGRLEPEKGIRKFIEHDFDSKRYRSFAIYGGGSERKNIESIIKEKNLSAKISLKGEIAYDDVIKEMSKVDAVVLPSICYENCPLVVCDALSLGKSVISSSAGGVSELLQLAENAETEFLKVSVYIENLLKIYHQEIERR